MAPLAELRRWRHVFDSSQNGIVVIDAAGIIIIYNRAAGMMLRVNPEEVIGTPISELFPSAWKDFQAVLKTGRPQLGKKLTLGESTIVANRNPIFDDGRVIGAISVFQDISEYERVFHELESYKRINEDLTAIINSSYDGLWICDREGRVVRINRSSEKMNNIRASQVIGRRMEELVQEGLIDRSVTLEVLKHKTAITLIQKLKNGNHILVTGNPVFDEKGEIRLVVVNERDITELNRLRNELEESRQLARRYQWELSNLQSHQEILSRLIFRSKAMQRVVETAMKVAKVSSTVVIQGESGVGKGLLAKIIHQASPRSNGPFIRVDCGAIPESLIESELFGYEEGAFTGARPKGKPGYFEMAEGGTLFLDDIGELPLNVQVKLLRFLEDNEVIRIGGTQTKKLDVRVIAATHRDLEEMVRRGTFRKDLFFRLNVVFIQIPPLRERPEDIPPLLHFFLKQFNRKCGAKKMITPQAVDLICKYEFPGNVRELANLVEQLVVLSAGEYIDWQDLPDRVRAPGGTATPPTPDNDLNLPKAVAALERAMIIQALKVYGSQRKAARPLGIDQSTLARKIKRYAIGKESVLHRCDE